MNSIDLKNEIENNPSKSFKLNILRHEKLGYWVTRTICDVERVKVVRIVQVLYGNSSGYIWRVESNISKIKEKFVPVVNNKPKYAN